MKRLLLLVGTVLFLTAGQASANILFTFSGVTFDDGGTLTGTFTTNDAITALIGFDITTSAGVGIGYYTPATAGSSSTTLPSIIVLSTPTLDNILQVTFSGLTALGAPIWIGMLIVSSSTSLPDETSPRIYRSYYRARAFDDRPAGMGAGPAGSVRRRRG
jgi:hypothetical protein